MVELVAYRERKETATILGDADRRGDLGGEVCRVEMSWCLGNWSPEYLLRTVKSGRRRSRCSGAQEGLNPCQRGVPDQGKGVWRSGGSREGRGSPEFVDVAGSTSGALSSGLGSLVAERLRERASVSDGVEALL
jgi:hypothetical protein